MTPEEKKAKAAMYRAAFNAKNPGYFKKYREAVKSGARTQKKRGVGEATPEPGSSPVEAPDAQTVVHLGPHGYPAD